MPAVGQKLHLSSCADFRSRLCLERLRYTVTEGGPSKATTAMANLAEAIQGLVQHMRAEQQMIRDWAEAQAKLNGEIRRFMEILARDSVHM